MAVTELTSENFDKEVNQSRTPVLIDFWAEWCGPCKMMIPVVDELAEEMGSSIKVCKVNVDNEKELAQKFNVMSIPTFVVLQEGKIKNTSVGVQTKQQLSDLIS